MGQTGKELAGLARKEVQEYSQSKLDFAPSFAQTTPQIIDLVDMYWVDRFRGVDVDDDGWKRAFYNVIENPVQIASKETDLDTKDIRIRAAEGQSYYPAWVYTRDINHWMKTKNFGVFLNEFVFKLPKYGTFIAKKVGNNIVSVPMHTIAFEATVENPKHSRFFTMQHEMAEHQFDEFDGVWGNLPAAKAEANQKPNRRAKVYERWGHTNLMKDRYQIVTEGGIILFTDNRELDDLYKIARWDEIRGRLAGRGVAEKLFEAQLNRNRVEEFKNKGLDWTSKIIFQTKDSTFARNLLSDVENGEVLTVNDPLTQVNNQEKNLPAYRDFEASWDKSIKERTFAFPEVAGERPPAGTPLGSTQLTLGQASTFYDRKREEMGLFIKEIVTDWVIPSFEKEREKEHTLMLGEFNEEELRRIKGFFGAKMLNEDVVDFVGRNGHVPDPAQVELMKGAVNQKLKKKHDLRVPSGFYNKVNFERTADVIITNEQVDVGAKLATLQTIFTLLAQNPAILDDPRTKRLFGRWTDLGGVNPVEINVDEFPDIEEAATIATPRSTGSAPAPAPIPANVRGAESAVV